MTGTLAQGPGFYVNATGAPWAAHYRMYDYVTEELPALIRSRVFGEGRSRWHLWPFYGRSWGFGLRSEKSG